MRVVKGGTLLRSSPQHGGKRRRRSPDVFQARIILLLALEARDAIWWPRQGVSARPVDNLCKLATYRRAQLGFAAPEASRPEGAKSRRGAGRLRSLDPCPYSSHPLVGVLSEETPAYPACASPTDEHPRDPDRRQFRDSSLLYNRLRRCEGGVLVRKGRDWIAVVEQADAQSKRILESVNAMCE